MTLLGIRNTSVASRLRASLLFASLVIPLALAGCGGGGEGDDDDDDDGGGAGGLPATASVPRGAQVYDQWWTLVGASAPTTTHPAYPMAGTQTGAATWSCVECHGWDYKGASGAYASGPHHSGVAGILPAAGHTPLALFTAIQGVGTAHDFGPYLATGDVWDLVAFVKSGALDTSPWIHPTTGVALGDAGAGASLYTARCASCHGASGATIDLGGGQGVGERADADPWQVLHHIRWGIPGSSMPGMEQAGLPLTQQAAILAHAQTLAGTVTPPPPPPPPPPPGLSYATDIKPIWAARNCTGCHGSSGGLTLSGTTAASYTELMAGRVSTASPSTSLILTKPLTGAGSHGGGKSFASTSDADYQKILTWITEGAKNN